MDLVSLKASHLVPNCLIHVKIRLIGFITWRMVKGVEVMQKNSLRNLVLFLVFGMMVFSQPAQLLSQIDAGQTKESTISHAGYTSGVSAAHITSPTTLPTYHEWETDQAILPSIPKVVSRILPMPDQFVFTFMITKATGFLDAIKYQSNYLP